MTAAAPVDRPRRLTGPAVPLIYKALGVRLPNSGVLHAEWQASEDALTVTVKGDTKTVMARTEYNGTLCVLAINPVSEAKHLRQLSADGSLMLAMQIPPARPEVSAPLPDNDFYDRIVLLRQQAGDAFRAAREATIT